MYRETAHTLILVIKCSYDMANNCHHLSDEFDLGSTQSISGHTIQRQGFGQRYLHYSIYCVNCNKIKQIIKIDVNYNSYEIDIDNLINLPEPDAQCLFDEDGCQYMIDDLKNINKIVGTLHTLNTY